LKSRRNGDTSDRYPLEKSLQIRRATYGAYLAQRMGKHDHEIRDPIHVFIRINSKERNVVNSPPVQRLRHVHQLALTYLLYPGATHRRFEHSLGVMELAGRVFDVVTDEDHLLPGPCLELVKEHRSELDYWRKVVRMAALCHDIGHLPFSHAAEDMLPDGWDHERISDELIRSPDVAPLWDDLKIRAADVAKLALGPKKFGPRKHREETFSNWEAILSEIIVGDAFGVDRMDYLLRDSYHAGVAYGRFDHFRLIDTLRILPKPESGEPALGIESGGVHSAEALLLARYFMYKQVYFHPVRKAYDFHLRGFLKEWLQDGRGVFSTDLADHLALTDNEVTAAIHAAARTQGSRGNDHARRVVGRRHFRKLYERSSAEMHANPLAARSIASAAEKQFGAEKVHLYTKRETGRPVEFPVLFSDGRVGSALSESDVLRAMPVLALDFVFVAPEIREAAENWLEAHRAELVKPLAPAKGENDWYEI
jgi:HD superfamily phosphohydrolase